MRLESRFIIYKLMNWEVNVNAPLHSFEVSECSFCGEGVTVLLRFVLFVSFFRVFVIAADMLDLVV